jgi:hypothetical protein
MDDMKWGLYLGRKSDFTTGFRADPFASAGTVIAGKAAGSALHAAFGTNGQNVFDGQNNPLEVFWGMKGDISYALSLSYSDSKNTKVNGANAYDATQQAIGVRAGAKADVWDAYANVGLISTAKISGQDPGGLSGKSAEYKGDMGFKVGGGYNMDNLYLHGSYASDSAKIEDKSTTAGSNPENAKRAVQQLTVGVVNPSKFEGGEFFYGVNLVYTTLKHELNDLNGNSADDYSYKSTSMKLPLVAGVEVDAASWLTLRGAVSQDLPFSTAKSESQTGTQNAVNGYANNKNNTSVTAGLGMKFGKLTFDGFLKGSTAAAGEFGSDDKFLSHASVTYNF